MKATITQKILLPGIQSASGIEVVGQQLFVVGDDSSWLHALDQTGNPLRKISLFPSETSPDGRIPKLVKPDLEAMTLLSVDSSSQLLIIGSGSNPNRERAFLVDVAPPYPVTEHSLSRLYNSLRNSPELGPRGILNIEGLVSTPERVIFLQRGNIFGSNTLIIFAQKEFVQFLSHPETRLPVPTFYHYFLPSVEGIPSGFSGAAAIPSSPHLILFTASVEATENEIDDGEMLGSFAGMIDLNQPAGQPLYLAPILREGQAFREKVESIAVWRETNPQSLETFAVTDSDGGDSELLRLRMEW